MTMPFLFVAIVFRAIVILRIGFIVMFAPFFMMFGGVGFREAFPVGADAPVHER